jgi:23S rRNA (cytosine1962-C5)-methyltransferase
MRNFTKIFLSKGKERSLRLFHPWIFSGAIDKIEGTPKEGETVEIFSAGNEYLATGHFHEGSIKVRIVSFDQTKTDQEFWNSKIQKAYELRDRLGLTNNAYTDIYRLVHAEGDGLPGLIIDIYGSAAVIQSHTLGMHKAKNEIVEALKRIYGKKLDTIYDKSFHTMAKQNLSGEGNSFLMGEIPEKNVKENDIQFYVNWVEGQRTGFFIDQRENRKLVEKYSEGKKVLNTFSYSGGFSMYALKGGAIEVHSVDSSKKASELAEKNIQLNNFHGTHKFFVRDAFDFLKHNDDKYDIVILDPPAFAKHLSSVDNAMIGYRNLNTEGIKKISKGGLLFTFSCSQVIDKILFRKLVFQSAAQTKRNVRIIHQLSQGPDHPINIYHPEGEYLKGIVAVID